VTVFQRICIPWVGIRLAHHSWICITSHFSVPAAEEPQQRPHGQVPGHGEESALKAYLNRHGNSSSPRRLSTPTHLAM
jgi:hypothetical protein